MGFAHTQQQKTLHTKEKLKQKDRRERTILNLNFYLIFYYFHESYI